MHVHVTGEAILAGVYVLQALAGRQSQLSVHLGGEILLYMSSLPWKPIQFQLSGRGGQQLGHTYSSLQLK